MSNGRSRHERVGHDSEKYRMDEIVFDTVENICQVVTLLWFTQRVYPQGGVYHHPALRTAIWT